MQLAMEEKKLADPPVPREEYGRRGEAQRQRAREWNTLERALGNGRVVVFLAGVGLAALSLATGWFSLWWVAAPAVLFVVLLVWYDRVLRAYRRAVRIAAYYEKGLARLDHDWAGRGVPGTRFLQEAHPNAVDLDLFGQGSLFELLCTARTRKGEETLAAWLLSPAPIEEVRARQAAVADLRPRLGLREDLALLGADVPGSIDLDRLASWAGSPPVLISPWARSATIVLGGLGVAALVGWLFFSLSSAPLAAVILVDVGFYLWLRRRVAQVIGPVDRRTHDLLLFAGILARFESEPFQAPLLVRLQEQLKTGGLPPSRRIAQLVRLVEMLDSRRNMLFAPVAALLLWTVQMAFAIEAWRAASGEGIPGWLAAVGEMEALCALAAHAYENPADSFPELTAAGPCFEGEGLGHPLIPAERCVRNDLHLGGELRLLVISGSNMSGKSTLLRTVGVNAVLAQAGAPVRARRLRLSSLAVGATLRIQDSLQAGKSRFYAEITRIRQIVEQANGPTPLLFLLDEILHGTNSHDRRLGAEAVVRGLLDRGAIGLVTTHDLALADIADRLAPRAANVHFEDQLVDGTITFDYHMRPGVVQHSNALALMRAVGLEV